MVHLGENPGMDGYITFNCLLLTKKKSLCFFQQILDIKLQANYSKGILGQKKKKKKTVIKL